MRHTGALPHGLAVHCHKYFNRFKSVTILIVVSLVFTFVSVSLLSDRKHLEHRYVHAYPNKRVVYPGVFLANRTMSCFPQDAVTAQSGGRLGNQIMEYASIWAVAKLYGLKPFAPETMTNRLKDLLESLNIPTTEEFVEKEVPCWEVKKAVTHADVIGAVEIMDQNVYSLDDIVDISKRSNRFIVLQPWNILVEVLVITAGKLGQEFRYKLALVAGAQTVLASIGNRMRVPEDSFQLGIYVGVHVRRTDYTNHLRSIYTVKEQAGVDYYRRAVQWMRSSLSKDAGREVNVAFVVASDDPAWCQQVLIPSLKKEATRGSDGLGQFDVFWGGQGDITTPEQDMVLLSSCNHSIFAYGTFGLWSALMAGGKTVVYNITASKGNRDTKGYTRAMQFAIHMDNWISL